ncbi:77 kDa echinoderm microtubule-associated protein [Nematostella vectensis]|uniref:77 kDa echinoderm microtubule-associated protein n=1 Tax=Nematostella vectensis TaxID=45351 RepID=UPI00207730FA|nr:77 kDa echinoderm microtubule-associated protein [Nematostella vectensis]XP_048579806.1 77 kDa echinoderm microtubule-associated protein [Nematostella vectensis]
MLHPSAPASDAELVEIFSHALNSGASLSDSHPVDLTAEAQTQDESAVKQTSHEKPTVAPSLINGSAVVVPNDELKGHVLNGSAVKELSHGKPAVSPNMVSESAVAVPNDGLNAHALNESAVKVTLNDYHALVSLSQTHFGNVSTNEVTLPQSGVTAFRRASAHVPVPDCLRRSTTESPGRNTPDDIYVKHTSQVTMPECLRRTLSDSSAAASVSTHVLRPVSPRRTSSFPVSLPVKPVVREKQVECDVNGNTKRQEMVNGFQADDKITLLETQVNQQRDEIVLLKSALADALRRLGSLEEMTKKPKGRMMPSIPTTSGQTSIPLRPSRISLPATPHRPSRSESDTDLQTSNIVKGLLRSMKGKSPTSDKRDSGPLSPRQRKNSYSLAENEAVNPLDLLRQRSKSEVSGEQNSILSPRKNSSVSNERTNYQELAADDKDTVNSPAKNGSFTLSPSENGQRNLQGSTLSDEDVVTNENGSVKIGEPPATHSTEEPEERKASVDSWKDDAMIQKMTSIKSYSPAPYKQQESKPQRPSPSPTSIDAKTKVKTSSSGEDSRTPSPSPGPSPRTSSSASRARVVSGGSGLKGKKNKWRSETDLSSRKNSSTASNPPVKKKMSTRSMGLKRASSVNSLNTKEEHQKASKGETTRLNIRGRSLNLYPPTGFVESKFSGQPPSEALCLEWVYGYRGRDCRDNLMYLKTGELVYNMAAVVVIYDEQQRTQRHYLGHNDDVKCIAVHPNQQYVASGQVAGHDKKEGRPHVRVWDSSTLDTLQVLGIGHFERAISCLAFSVEDQGRHLVAVDEANEHVISLWDWERNSKITETKGASDPVLMVTFNPRDSSSIVSCGKSHIAFWSALDSGGLVKKMGVFGKFDKPRFVLCTCFLFNGDLLTGDSNGTIFVWAQGTNNISNAILDAHEGPVFTLCALHDGRFLSGGGRDRLVVLWDENYQPIREMQIPESAGPVRAIVQGTVQADGTPHIAIGTTRNSLLHGTFDQGVDFIIKGHTDELWGLAVHPSDHVMVTCGYDKQIIMWDAADHTVMWHSQLEESLQSAAFHPTAFVLAVGTQSGNWMVLDALSGDQIAAFHDGPEQLDAIKYSPDGKFIAVGSHDNFIYLYTVSEDGRSYRRHGKLSGHSSFVTHLDWCVDSQYIQSNSGDYELLYWNAARCKQVVSAQSMRDIKWHTWTCVLGFPVCGIWPDGADGTDINACARSNLCHLLVTGDDFGQVNFFRYPSSRLKSDCQNCCGHSSHVTCVRFLHDDSRVISTGGKDCSVMQWKVHQA